MSSFAGWPRQRSVESQHRCVPERARLGACGGQPCWRAARARQSHFPYWRAKGGLGSDGATPSTSDVIGDSRYAGFPW